MQAVRYRARDGQMIPAYLTVPKGVEGKALPTLLLPHGGPWARDVWGYDPIVQFLANRGYAVLTINFRGSTGYGKAFLNAGNETWGTGTMQHDITDGARWLVEQGIADPERLGIVGGSYGGYATLAGLAFTPDLYAAGVSIVGPSNIITLLNSIPPYWGPIKKIFSLRVGDPTDPEDKARLEAQSPFFHAERIEAPLLVIQGANDPRVKQAESDQIVVRLRDLGRQVEYVVAPDEGHGFAGRENRLAMFAAIEEFFAEHLGGRFQESMDEDVAERLAAMTVDVAEVEMPAAASDADAAMTAPLPAVTAGALAEGTFGYRSVVSRGGQEMELLGRRTTTREERDGRAVVVVVSEADGPMGAVTDTYLLDAASLRPVSREAVQGPVRIDVAYGPQAATGQIQAGPQQLAIDVPLPAPVFGDGAALEVAVAALPLAEGYEATLRTFEVGMMQRVRVWSLAVEGRETVEVPAGEMEAWRVRVEPLDGEGGGETLWVRTEQPPVVVKAEGQLPPASGGGTVTTELVSIGE
jgi:dienelactone hydrolase